MTETDIREAVRGARTSGKKKSKADRVEVAGFVKSTD